MAQFKPGQSGNPKGRTKGSFLIHTQLERAIAKVSKEKGIDIYEHFVKRAIAKDAVLVALLKKLVPDRQFSEGEVGKIINIVYAYREQDRLNNSPLRSEREGQAELTTANSKESS